MGLNCCGNIPNGSEHGLIPSSPCTQQGQPTYVNAAIFTQHLHHYAHVTGASEASVSNERSSRSERCYLYYVIYSTILYYKPTPSLRPELLLVSGVY